MLHKQTVETQIHQILQEQDTTTAQALLNTTLTYMLDNFPAPVITDEIMDLGVYVLNDGTLHFYTDNYADLPDELYPLAAFRVVAVNHTNRRVIDPTYISAFDEFSKRYHKIIGGKYTNTSLSTDADDGVYGLASKRARYKAKEQSARDGKQAGLTARAWLHTWNEHTVTQPHDESTDPKYVDEHLDPKS
jgi:hypothetical protein